MLHSTKMYIHFFTDLKPVQSANFCYFKKLHLFFVVCLLPKKLVDSDDLCGQLFKLYLVSIHNLYIYLPLTKA